MKKLFILTLFAAFVYSSSAQTLLDMYKSGPVVLEPDREYAIGNDWNKVFETYYDTLYGAPMGNRKSLKVMPDGSVVVNHRYRNFFTKFRPDGRYDMEFGITNSAGHRIQNTEHIEAILNGNTFISGVDNVGNMMCFDFDGKLKKTLNLDYMVKQIVALPNNKLAVVGWSIWSNRSRDFVAIVDYETNEEKIIWDHFTDRCKDNSHCKLFNYSYNFKDHGSIGFSTMPWIKSTGMSSPPKIAEVGDELIVAIPTTGEILVYDLDGALKSKEKIGWARNFISVEEQQEIQQKAIDKYMASDDRFSHWVSAEESKTATNQIVKEMEDDLRKISAPIPIPVFSTIIKDSDDNLLFFEFPKEENTNQFNVWVYNGNGAFVCKSSFICDDYDLFISPSKLVFHKGHLYGLQLLKESSGVPLRLVRFKVGGGS